MKSAPKEDHNTVKHKDEFHQTPLFHYCGRGPSLDKPKWLMEVTHYAATDKDNEYNLLFHLLYGISSRTDNMVMH